MKSLYLVNSTLGLSFGAVILVSVLAEANSGISYQGRILRPDGSPLEGRSVQFRLQIRSPGNEDCLMYEEIQTKDMKNSGGKFSLTMNDGSGERIDDRTYLLERVFANYGSFSFDGDRCKSHGKYEPKDSDGRKLVVYFKDEYMRHWEALPPMKFNFTPMALQSIFLGGFSVKSLLRVENASGPQQVPSLTPQNFTDLMALLNGTSTKYAPPASSSTGTSLVVSNTTPSSAQAGSMWFDAGTQTIKYHDGTGVKTVGNSTAAPIDLTKLTSDVKTSGNLSATNISGKSGSFQSVLIYNTSNTASVAIESPSLPSSYKLILPANAGSHGQALMTDGNGNLSWSDVNTQRFPTICSASETMIWNSVSNSLMCTPIRIASSALITPVGVQNGGTGLTTMGTAYQVLSVNASGTGLEYRTITIDTGNTANKIVQLDNLARLPAVDGSALTNLSASNISGIISPSSLPALNGDVSTSQGSMTSTVERVGGSLATDIHNAEVAANSATSENTAGAIMKRNEDGQVKVSSIALGKASLRGPLTDTTYSLTMPETAGSNGQMLTTDGSGNLTWTNPPQESPERLERARVIVNCSTPTCPIADKTSGIASITRSSPGMYSINFQAGVFSAVPTCVINVQSKGLNQNFVDQGDEYQNHTTTAVTFRSINSRETAAVDASFSVICMGPR